MPRRFSVNTRAWIYRFLCLRDGEQCALCFTRPTQPISATQNELSETQNGASGAISATQNAHSRRRRIVLEIDHIDGNSKNNTEENYRLLCKSCNVAESNRRRSSSDLFVCVQRRRRREGNSATRVARTAVDYSTGGAEMRANQIYEVRFRNWLLGTLNGTDHLEKDDAINSGAEITGCSTSTAARYLSKLTSSAGPLCEITDLTGRTVIALKPELKITSSA